MAMTATLTSTERQIGIGLSVMLAILGLTMAAVAKQGGPMAVHGAMALVLGLTLVFVLSGALYDQREPSSGRLTCYYDAPTRFGIVMTLFWAVAGMTVGVWLAALMYWPEATPLWPATSY